MQGDVTPTAPVADSPSKAAHHIQRGRCFSDWEKNVLRKLFWVNGKKPTRFVQADIERASEESVEFQGIWQKLMMKAGTSAMRIIRGRNAIRKSIMSGK